MGEHKTQTCSHCGKELPIEEFRSRWKAGVKIMKRCRCCRQKYYQEKKKGKEYMPWYEDWVLIDRPFIANRYEKYEKPRKCK